MNLELENVAKSYDRGNTYALRDVNLSIQPGIFGMLGPNGAGKTTLMRILATSLMSSRGKIRCGELDWSKPANVRKQLGYLPQHFEMFAALTVKETLEQAAFFKNITGRKQVNEEIECMLETVHLTDYASRRVSKLSGGMLRRLGIAQAMIGHPVFLIIDEPTVGLDPAERMHIRKVLREYNKDNRFIIISSHIVEDVETVCDTVTIMNHGVICAYGTVEELSSRADPFVCSEELSMEQYLEVEKEHLVIHYRPVGDKVHVRYIAHKNEPTDHHVPARLEDSYLAMIGGELSHEALDSGGRL